MELEPDEPADIVAPPRAYPQPPPTQAFPAFACRHCKSQDLTIVYGQYGYYFKCSACDGNTPIDYKCSACGHKGKISKSGKDFSKKCAHCQTDEVFFSNSSSR